MMHCTLSRVLVIIALGLLAMPAAHAGQPGSSGSEPGVSAGESVPAAHSGQPGSSGSEPGVSAGESVPAAHSGQPGSSGSEPGVSSGDTLRVLTYNIRHGRGMDGRVDIGRIAEVIRQKRPHLVALQEVDVGVERSHQIDIMTALAGYLRMQPVFFENIPHQGGSYGNGLLTSLPLYSSRNLHYVATEGEQRGLLQAEVDLNGALIAIMNTHLDHRSEADRLSSVEQIIETTRAYRGMPIILAGDMNAMPGSGTHLRLTESFRDVWDEIGDGPGYTFPPTNPSRRIDYFFYSNEIVQEGKPRLRAIKIEVIETDASDHLPIYAEFEVVRQ
jgi:endonuclease/exonuclease/phosphatase family metal-dependent hydrolase